jgi:hypothetical protein
MPATNSITSWLPEPGWLLLLPSRLPDRRGELFLPESYTKKSNSGICFSPHDHILAGKECFFPSHQEYQIIDSDTGYLLYIIEANKVILTREPPPDVVRASREKGEGIAFATLQSSNETH